MQRFQFYSPNSLEDALEYIADRKQKCRTIAGGTDLIPALKKEDIRPDYLLNINEIDELKGVEAFDNQVRIGATTTFTEMIESETLNRFFPLLVTAAASVGGPQIRNRGTIGGNVVTNGPCADVLPGIVALDGKLELLSKQGGRRLLPVADALVTAHETRIRPDELLTAVLVQKPMPGTKSGFEKLGRRNAMAKARLNLSIVLRLDPGEIISAASIVPGAVMPVAARMKGVESILICRRATPALIQDAADALAEAFVSKAGIRWSTEYKVPVLKNVFKRVMLRVLAEAPQ
jgi:CO/xanthine dehydrogenase FAD-binding subunit